MCHTFASWLKEASDGDVRVKAEEIADRMTFIAPDLAEMLLHAKALGWLGEAEFTDVKLEDRAPVRERLKCRRWWTRRLMVSAAQARETVERGAGRVNRRAAYLSDDGMRRIARRRVRTLNALQAAVAVAPTGEEIKLADCIAASVSNPSNRRAEMMVRLKGMSEVCAGRALVPYALTATAPSKYHALKTVKQGLRTRLVPNDKWEAFGKPSPRSAQSYLCAVWARVRALWKKRGYTVTGFRAVEPHKDGTPHWHLIVFLPQADLARLLAIFRREFMREDRDEDGARKYRVKIKKIDTSMGGAVAYAAAYVSKNIDGHALLEDLESGLSGADGAQRATAWASLWRIRQFQFFGMPSVTAWREARRVRGDVKAKVEALRDSGETLLADAAAGVLEGRITPVVDAFSTAMKTGRVDVLGRLSGLRDAHATGRCRLGPAWEAADRGDWGSYMRATPLYLIKVPGISIYGDDTTKVRGIGNAETGAAVITREEGWKVEWRKPAPDAGLALASAERAQLGSVAITVTVSSGGYETRQAGVEKFSSDLMRQKRARQARRKPIYSFQTPGFR